MIVYEVQGVDALEGKGWDTEDGAYAALGQHMTEVGYWDPNWHVLAIATADAPQSEPAPRRSTPLRVTLLVEVDGHRLESGPPERAEPVLPAWPVGAKLPRPWRVEDYGGEDGTAIVDQTGRHIMRVCAATLSETEDKALARYLVDLVNADAEG